MTDIVDQPTRSRMMSGIRSTNTKPEIRIRKLLHRQGFRFKLHDKKLPGKPDIVLPKFHAAIFVNGCFWHGHNCYLFKMPSTRQDFWKTKIENNRKNDVRSIKSLRSTGWRVATIWECAMRGPTRQDDMTIVESLTIWLYSADNRLEIVAGIKS